MRWILIAFTAIIVALFAFQMRFNTEYNNWTARCNRDGGIVEQTRVGLVRNQVECFKDGKIIDHEN